MLTVVPGKKIDMRGGISGIVPFIMGGEGRLPFLLIMFYGM